RGAADRLAARIAQASAVESRFGFGFEAPVRTRVADGKEVTNRYMKPNPIVISAGLEHQHALAGIGRKPVGKEAAGRARAYDDIVELALDRLRLRHRSLPPNLADDNASRQLCHTSGRW